MMKASSRGGDRLVALLCLGGLLVLTVTLALLRSPPAPRSIDAPAQEFSAARAFAATAPLLATPRVTGEADHSAARQQLVRTLTALGLQVRVEPGLGVYQATDQEGPTTVVGHVNNIVAEHPGTRPSGTLVLAAHYDSVVGSPGAGDDGSGLATVLETVRGLLAQGRPRNDLVVLLTDGEEQGMLGAEAFTSGGKSTLRSPVVVLNHDARGVSGVPLLVRTTGSLNTVLEQVPHPEFESFTETVFGLLPNDTDYSRFTQAGWAAVDLALVGDGARYHSPLDSAAALDQGSLQRAGEMTFSMADALADADLPRTLIARDEVVTTVPWGLLRLPTSSVLPSALLALGFALAAVALRRRRGEVRLRQVPLAAVAVLGSVIVGTAFGGSLWPLARAIDPSAASSTVQEPYRPLPYLLAEVLTGVLAATAGFALTRRPLRTWGFALGSVLLVTCLVVALAATLPGLASLFLLPLLSTTLAGFLAVFTSGIPRVIVLAIGALSVAYFAALQLDGWFEFGIGSAAGSTTVFTMVAVLLIMPLLALAWPDPLEAAVEDSGPLPVQVSAEGRSRRLWGRRLTILTAGLTVPVVATGWGLLTNRSTPLPRQENVGFQFDADQGSGSWSGQDRSEWARSLPPGRGRIPALPPPQIRVLSDIRLPQSRRIRLEARSSRAASRLTLRFLDHAVVTRVKVDGRQVSRPDAGPLTLAIAGLPVAGSRIDFDVVGPHRPLRIEVSDQTYDLRVVPGYRPPPADWVVVQPDVVVSTVHPLP